MNEDKENRRQQKAKRNRAPKTEADQDTCLRCGKTPRTGKSRSSTNPPCTPALSINLIKGDNPKSSKKCKSRCKHKEELAKYTNVSVTTAETTCSESERSYSSTVCTQVTQRSMRSIVRESNANKEIARLQGINSLLSSQLDTLAKGVTVRDLLCPIKDPSQLDNTTSALYLDNTLTPNGDPALLSPANSPDHTPRVEELVRHNGVTIRMAPHETPGMNMVSPSVSPTEREPTYTLQTPRSLPRSSQHSSRTDIRKHSPGTPERGVQDSGYASVKEKAVIVNGTGSNTTIGHINKELLLELEEENEALRRELRASTTTTQELVSLEQEIRRLKTDSSKYQCEILRLRDVETKLIQVEQFYHNEKKSFRCTIEDTLLTLEDFRRDKEDLEREMLEVEEKLKDALQKKGSLREELSERNTLLANSVEKLKLELETGQSENAMLQTRVTTVEENCSFLEGQVQALERDNQEKTQIIAAAEQHAKDMDRELARLGKENAALQSEQHRLDPLQHELEQLKTHMSTLREEKTALQSNLEKAEEENTQLHARLSDLVKSHTKLEENVQNKERLVQSLQQEQEKVKREAEATANTAKEKESETHKESEQLKEENSQLVLQLEKLKEETEYIEQAFFRGWSDHIDEGEEKSVTFQDENRTATFPKADRIIQSIKLDRQKLKAKLVRSVQDAKTLQSQLHETQDALDRESAGLAKRLRDALDRFEESEVKGHVLERTAKNLSTQVEELNVVNKSLELENYHLKKLTETLGGASSPQLMRSSTNR